MDGQDYINQIVHISNYDKLLYDCKSMRNANMGE